MEENKKNNVEAFDMKQQPISDEELANAAGGGGCSSYGCRECGIAFSNKEEWIQHFEVAHGCRPPEA